MGGSRDSIWQAGGQAEPLGQAKERPECGTQLEKGEQTVPCLPSPGCAYSEPSPQSLPQGWIASGGQAPPYSMVSAVAGPPPTGEGPFVKTMSIFFSRCWLQDPLICVLQVKVGNQLQGQG